MSKQIDWRSLITLFLIGSLSLNAYSQEKPATSILVFSKTLGYRHESIAAGKKMFLDLGRENKINVDTTEDASFFNDQRLQGYNAVVFLSTSGNVLDTFQQEAFQKYIRHGGAFVGIHGATCTEYDWPWFNKLVGAYFDDHPKPQQANYTVVDKNFPATRDLPDAFPWYDEVYNFRSVQDSLHYLITVDESSYEGGKMGKLHPVCWYHTFEGARSFYLALGHFADAYEDPYYRAGVWKGLLWALRKED